MTDEPKPTPEESPGASRKPSVKVWTSQDLFGDDVEVIIRHGEQTYRLRRTRNGKLILNK